VIPAIPPLSFTGGMAGPSSSGDASGGNLGDAGGISSPVVVGGFKSDGTATGAGVLPAWFAPVAVVIGLVLAVALYRRK